MSAPRGDGRKSGGANESTHGNRYHVTTNSNSTPVREWNRATEVVRLFVATGFIDNARSQSMLFNSAPGSGKTELLERFMCNDQLSFASDLTSRGILQVLRKAQRGAVTHVVATEFQKFFMRKSSTAENMLGTLTQALEEGVRDTYVGDKLEQFDGTRIGLIGAITGETLNRRATMLREVGFTSRVAIFRWGMPEDEMKLVMKHISEGNVSDLEPVHLALPDKKIKVHLSVKLSDSLSQYCWRNFREHTILRVYNRFRALVMASAILDKRDVVKADDVERVYGFHDYWKIMERG